MITSCRCAQRLDFPVDLDSVRSTINVHPFLFLLDANQQPWYAYYHIVPENEHSKRHPVKQADLQQTAKTVGILGGHLSKKWCFTIADHLTPSHCTKYHGWLFKALLRILNILTMWTLEQEKLEKSQQTLSYSKAPRQAVAHPRWSCRHLSLSMPCSSYPIAAKRESPHHRAPAVLV